MNPELLLLVLLACCWIGPSDGAGNADTRPDHQEFCYRGPRGPEFWSSFSPSCGGKSQSPINIDTSLTSTDIKLPPVTFGPGYSANIKGTMQNNGHTIVFTPSEESKKSLVASGGPMGADSYLMEQFHFHWGSCDAQGSEHTINRKRFPLEMHLVHRNAKYPSFEVAKGKQDGVAVVAVLFEKDPYHGHREWQEGVRPNQGLCNEMMGLVEKIVLPGKSVPVPAMNLSTHFHLQFHKYFLYSGSLTTPGCTEGVKWIIPTCFSKVTCEQLEIFRKARAKVLTESLSDNFRPTQCLNHRRVYSVKNSRYGGGVGHGYPPNVYPGKFVPGGPESGRMSPIPGGVDPAAAAAGQTLHDVMMNNQNRNGNYGGQLHELNDDMKHYSDVIKKKILSAYEAGSTLEDIKASLGLKNSS